MISDPIEAFSKLLSLVLEIKRPKFPGETSTIQTELGQLFVRTLFMLVRGQPFRIHTADNTITHQARMEAFFGAQARCVFRMNIVSDSETTSSRLSERVYDGRETLSLVLGHPSKIFQELLEYLEDR